MIIMQTEDAKKRRSVIESKGLAKVIFSVEHGDSVCIQYHPRGIKGNLPSIDLSGLFTTYTSAKGGMMPELDSHSPTPENPTPLATLFSPWHACGSDYRVYGPGMKRTSHLSLEGVVCRLEPGNLGHEAASRQWEEIFGVPRSRDLLAFTNARLGFIPGREGQPEGLVSVTVGVNGKEKLEAILHRASKEGLCGDGWINMVGIKWYFVLTGVGESRVKL